jgi:hypothetical protein
MIPILQLKRDYSPILVLATALIWMSYFTWIAITFALQMRRLSDSKKLLASLAVPSF